MREIEFRAWSDKFDNMIYSDDREYSIDVLNNTIWKDCVCDQGVNLMQYTGLKDCTGKEIYEGDIISIKLSDGKIINDGFVIYDKSEGRFAVKHETGYKGFWGLTKLYISWCDYKVIGNIYQHPELLTLEKSA